MANPSRHHQQYWFNGNTVPGTPATARRLKHNPRISLDWTPREQAILEELLSQPAPDMIGRYAKISMQLKNKTVRDVALRVLWMNKNENSKRRKDGRNLKRKSKEKKEKVYDAAANSSQLAAQLGVSSYAPTMMMMDNNGGISNNATGVPTVELLEQNEELLKHISANLAACNLQDNIKLFCHTRDNINKICNDLNMAEVMSKMPPLPKLNESMLNSILSGTNQQMK